MHLVILFIINPDCRNNSFEDNILPLVLGGIPGLNPSQRPVTMPQSPPLFLIRTALSPCFGFRVTTRPFLLLTWMYKVHNEHRTVINYATLSYRLFKPQYELISTCVA